jgi:hypothetical protein
VGSQTFTLYDAHDVTGTMTFGTPFTLSTTSPGQNGVLTFTATAGQSVSLAASSGPSGSLTVKDASQQMVGSTSIGIGTHLVEPMTLAAGTYTVAVDYLGSGTGTTTLTLYDVPADLTGTITPGGAAVISTVGTPGQNAVYTMATPTNNRVSLAIAANGAAATVRVLRADGSTVTTGTAGTAASFVEPWVFASGQQVKVDLSGATTGSDTLVAYDVPPDVSGSVTIGGAAANVTIAASGQNGALTFSGTASQQVTVHATNNTLSSQLTPVTINLLSTDGTTVLTSKSSISSSFDLSTVTLPATGTYTVTINPAGTNTGGVSINVTSP